jgi:hypothetical protein
MRAALLVATTMAVLTACGSSTADDVEQVIDMSIETTDDSLEGDTGNGGMVGTDTTTDEQAFPDVLDASASQDGDSWTISATLSSPYDTPDRYADAWRVLGADGSVYGERVLTHDHASEQPFTRSESGIVIPNDVGTVTIEGRDLENGYGGETFVLRLPR